MNSQILHLQNVQMIRGDNLIVLLDFQKDFYNLFDVDLVTHLNYLPNHEIKKINITSKLDENISVVVIINDNDTVILKVVYHNEDDDESVFEENIDNVYYLNENSKFTLNEYAKHVLEDEEDSPDENVSEKTSENSEYLLYTLHYLTNYCVENNISLSKALNDSVVAEDILDEIDVNEDLQRLKVQHLLQSLRVLLSYLKVA